MNATLKKTTVHRQTTIKITGSKSETNRLLLLKALFPNIHVENISNSDDSEAMQKALQEKAESSDIRIVDIHHAGTAMRFLTAFLLLRLQMK